MVGSLTGSPDRVRSSPQRNKWSPKETKTGHNSHSMGELKIPVSVDGIFHTFL